MIPKIVLDPQNDEELIAQSYRRIAAASEGQLSDFNPSSPISALIEGQVYSIAELLWFLNQLPEALALEVLRLQGVERSPGTKAKGYVVTLLSTSRSGNFTIPEGTILDYQGNQYRVTQVATIPSGALEAKVPIEALEVGTTYNLRAYTVSGNLGLAGIQTTYNPEPISGGTDLESLDSLLVRAQVALSSRSVLVTASDYELKAQELLGEGSKAYCVPLLADDRLTLRVGSLSLFCAGSDKKPINSQTQANLRRQLTELSFVGADINVFPVTLQPLRVDIVAAVDQVSPKQAEAIAQALTDYLSIDKQKPGQTILVSEVSHVARSVPGVSYVLTVLLNGQPLNAPMLQKYAIPSLGLLTLEIRDKVNNSTSYTGYYGSDPAFTEVD